MSVEAQNMFNLDVIKPKNQFALHLAYYTYCYQYENTNTTDAPLTIFSPKGDKGDIGDKGNGIESSVDNGDGTITFVFEDGTTYTTNDL